MTDDGDARERRMRSRTGLRRLGTQPMSQAFDAVRRSLPRTQDAIRLFDLVEERLGERGVRDWWANKRERCLLLRDPERPDWFLPRRLLYLELDLPEQPKITIPFEPPDWLKELIPPRDEEPEAAEEPVTLGGGGRSGQLGIEEGPAHCMITYDDRGNFKEWMVSNGDPHFFALQKTEPFHLDANARPAQVPPLSFLTREELRPEGHPVDELADKVLAMRPDLLDPGRVYVPVVQPGNVTGAWARALAHLRAAAWDGRVPDEAGWIVIDAWNGTAIATGSTLDDAFTRWKEVVGRVQPLPPVDKPCEPEAAMEPPGPARSDEETRTVAVGFKVEFVVLPPVSVEWPEPRPEHVPAIALPMPAAPAVPDALAVAGFTRVVRFFGEHGQCAFGFVRDEPEGFTLVGDDAALAIDPTRLDADIDRADAERAVAHERMFTLIGRNPLQYGPPRRLTTSTYRVWDDEGVTPLFRHGSYGLSDLLGEHGWGLERRHEILRVRRRTG